jgi:hypothetical protein
MVIVGAYEIGKFMGGEPPQVLPVVVVPLAIAPVCEKAHPDPALVDVPAGQVEIDRLLSGFMVHGLSPVVAQRRSL